MRKLPAFLCLVIAITLSACSPREREPSTTIIPTSRSSPASTSTSTPTPASTPSPTRTPTAVPAPAVQIDLFRFIPPDYVAAFYCDLQTIREDPDLKLIIEASSNGCGAEKNADVDAFLSLVLPATVSSDFTISSVLLHRGNFDQEAIMEQEDFSGASIPDYQGVELSMIEHESGLMMVSAFIDETTWVLSMNEAGVKAVIDHANSLETSPFADLGSALPHVFLATMMKCQYEACIAHVQIGLVKGLEGPISIIQLFQFESTEMAADVLPEIRARQEAGPLTLYGSGTNPVPIIGDSTMQEGRFIMVEGVLPLEDLPRMFE